MTSCDTFITPRRGNLGRGDRVFQPSFRQYYDNREDVDTLIPTPPTQHRPYIENWNPIFGKISGKYETIGTIEMMEKCRVSLNILIALSRKLMLVSQLSSNKDNLNCKLAHFDIFINTIYIIEFFVGICSWWYFTWGTCCCCQGL